MALGSPCSAGPTGMLLSIDVQWHKATWGNGGTGLCSACSQTLAATNPEPGKCWLVTQRGPGEFPSQGQANWTEG